MRTWPAGVGAVVAAVVAALVLAVDGTGALTTGLERHHLTVYGQGQVVLAIVLGVAGLLLLAVRGRVVVTGVLGVAGLCAAQLAGTGLVARRRWPMYRGCCADQDVTDAELVRRLALVLAVVCAVAALVCLVTLARGHLLRRPGADLRFVVAVTTAVVVAGLGARLAAGDLGHDVAAWSLMYGIPFAVALTLTAVVPRAAGVTLAAGVAASALAAQAGASFLELRQPWDGALAVVLAGSAVAAAGLLLPSGTGARAAGGAGAAP